MNIELTEAEVHALADVAELAADRDGAPMPLVTAWLKLVRAQAQQVTAPAPTRGVSGIATAPPGVGAVDSVPAPMPGVTRMGAGTLSSDTWGLR